MLIVLVAALASLVVCVAIHYQLLAWLSSALPRLHTLERRRVMLGIIGAISAHVIEICVFALAFALLHRLPVESVGELAGAEADAATDFIYCSAMSYTTLGFASVMPVGPIRLLVGVEALVGLVLVAWTASFTFMQMQNYWSEHGRR